MRLRVVLRSEDQLASAGVRIRYARLEPELERRGIALKLLLLDKMAAEVPYGADAYVFCKCHDARSLLLARAIRAAGRWVGIDVFDDYFSQEADTRFVHLRRWLAEMAPVTDFALCATPAMAERLGRAVPELPVHVLNDPAPRLDSAAASEALARKADEARRTGIVEVAWFGMGDNPHFPVGLDDLAAWGGSLAEFRSAGLEPRLGILSNRRAFTPERLEGLARLPVPARLDEWTPEAEAALLGRSLVAFLPVNAQPFSTAKSLNRAATTLASGTQVLTAGYPLYRPFDAFLYRGAGDLARDLRDDRLRLRPETLPRLGALLARTGESASEADALAGFLAGLRGASPGRAAAAPSGGVLHGVGSHGKVNDLARSLGLLSVASPFTDGKLPADLRLDQESEGAALSLMLTERAVALLADDLRPLLAGPFEVRGRPAWRLALVDALPAARRREVAELLASARAARRLSERLAIYPGVMGALRDLARRLFPTARDLTLSEDKSPFGEGAGRVAEAVPEPARAG